MATYVFWAVSPHAPGKRARSIKLMLNTDHDIRITVNFKGYFQEKLPCVGTITETTCAPLFPVGKSVTMVRSMSDVTIED